MTPDSKIAAVCFEGDGKSGATVCATCETEVDTRERHPASVSPEDGSTLYLFCSPACREQWQPERNDGTGECDAGE